MLNKIEDSPKRVEVGDGLAHVHCHSAEHHIAVDTQACDRQHHRHRQLPTVRSQIPNGPHLQASFAVAWHAICAFCIRWRSPPIATNKVAETCWRQRPPGPRWYLLLPPVQLRRLIPSERVELGGGTVQENKGTDGPAGKVNR